MSKKKSNSKGNRNNSNKSIEEAVDLIEVKGEDLVAVKTLLKSTITETRHNRNDINKMSYLLSGVNGNPGFIKSTKKGINNIFKKLSELKTNGNENNEELLRKFKSFKKEHNEEIKEIKDSNIKRFERINKKVWYISGTAYGILVATGIVIGLLKIFG